jgi:carbon monoxide dehydrogenase subunit G
MSKVVVSIEVNAPIENVFEVFTELDKAEERIPGITKLEMLSEGPVGEGTKWRETRIMMKKEAVETMWITGFSPPNQYTVEANSHDMLYQTLFEFKETGSNTHVTWSFVGTPQTFGTKIMDPIFGFLFKGMAKKCLMEDLVALKGVCES